MIKELQYLPLDDVDRDRLGFRGKAEEIAGFINDFSPKLPYCLSINGSWGAGKSTMLNFIATNLDKGKCITVRFNPWMISEREELIKNLFEEIYYAMGEGNFHKARDKFFKYAEKVVSPLTKVATFATAYLNGVNPTVANTTANVTGETVQGIGDLVFDKPLSKRKHELNKIMDETVREDGRKIVIMIDELDRLFPEEVITIFQMIKSNLDLPGLFFVIAMDQEVVFDALKKEGISKPEYYLQKIFQRRYLINTKYQIRTLSQNFILEHLNFDSKSHNALGEAILAYFYLNESHYVYSPKQSPSFYRPELSDNYKLRNDSGDYNIRNSYNIVAELLGSQINFHNPRTFLRFSEILIEKWDKYYNHIFELEKDIKRYVYVSFLIFICYYAYPDYTEPYHLQRDKSKDDDRPLFIQEVANHIQQLIPTFTYENEDREMETAYCNTVIRLAVNYLNQFPDFAG
ncbi:P-loop NTPase fold protein [Bacillus sp. 196mf]|uniref:KAP family P-loop NTPase fold protein n=1 Tax=Bacillus sp. 196mf TaxID=1761754 RepID=UPI000D7BD47F|nr:P-loop NTPase fold protein [Bacillus sp. 196mf]PYE96172.1 KAP-like P-loop domain-containing protein [Bacillus sp. 196mf]